MSHSVSVTSSGASSQATCSCGFHGFVRSNPAAAATDAKKHAKKAN